MRFLSGVQPSGELHLGNYFGAIEQHIALQHEGEGYYFIADFHAMTSVRDREKLLNSSRDVALTYLSLGLDPEKAVFFRQSDVPEVTELTWIFATVTGMGLLERATSYKDKVARGLKSNVGLFLYPILMAADILIYKPDLVPVGADQVQHIEIAQDIGGYFNNTYAPVFKRPEVRLNAAGKKVPGTDGQKMSKSYGNTIPIFASKKKLKKAINAIVTDSKAMEEPMDGESCNIVALYSLLASADEVAEMKEAYRRSDYGYGHAKVALGDKIRERFGEASARREEMLKKPHEVEEILQAGAARARLIAQETMAEVREACGLRAPR